MGNSHRISENKSFISKDNRKRINYPLGKDDSKRFEKNLKKILYAKETIIYLTCISKHKLNQ